MSDKPAYMQAAAAVAVKIAEVRRARRAAFRNVETKEGRQEFLILQREVDEQYGVLLRMIVDELMQHGAGRGTTGDHPPRGSRPLTRLRLP